MSCYDSQVIQRITAIQLDECGRIPLTGDNPTPVLKGLAATITNVTRSRQVDLPTETVLKAVNGGTCVKPLPSPTDRGYNYTLTFCGENPLFEVITGYKTLDLDGVDIEGWEDSAVTTAAKVALEIIFTPSADSCAGGGAAQCRALLIPLIEQWVRSGDETYDGEVTPDLVMSARTTKSSNLFANYGSGAAIPAWLSHWSTKYADIATGRAWSYNRFIDCPAEDTGDACVLVAL